jgi:phosphate uptake regulator
MASIRNLKKDINNVLGDLIDAVYFVEQGLGREISEAGDAIIDQAIMVFDRLIEDVNKKDIENPKFHFKKIRENLLQEATELVHRINQLS